MLTRAVQSEWRWSGDIELTHVYLSPVAVKDVAIQIYDRDVYEVELFDVLRADDPVLSGIAGLLARESWEGGLGGRLYVDSPFRGPAKGRSPARSPEGASHHPSNSCRTRKSRLSEPTGMDFRSFRPEKCCIQG